MIWTIQILKKRKTPRKTVLATGTLSFARTIRYLDTSSSPSQTQDVFQVARVKTKWKCILKDGMIHVNGKDYLFAKCTG